MSNGATDPYSLESISSEQILGGGTQDFNAIMKALFGTLQTAGYGKVGTGDEAYTPTWEGFVGGREDYSYEDWMSYLDPEETYGESQIAYSGGGYMTGNKPMAENLLKLLKKLDIPGLQKGYGQDVGDIGAEIGAQMGELTSGLGRGAKSSRYGKIASGGRNIGQGGKAQYLSDYYGLQEQQYSMQQDLQKQLEDEFSTQVGQYMQFNPVTEE